MRLRRPRFTTRALMVGIAILALILGGSIELSRRHRRFLKAYRDHALLEYEAGVKAWICAGSMGSKGMYHPSVAEVEAIWELDAEERRLFEAEGEDLLVMIAEAGWTNRKKIPVRINFNETLDRERLGPLLRREEYHRALRKKYRRAARVPWLPVEPDPPGPANPGES